MMPAAAMHHTSFSNEPMSAQPKKTGTNYRKAFKPDFATINSDAGPRSNNFYEQPILNR